jgi:hypothetical protein
MTGSKATGMDRQLVMSAIFLLVALTIWLAFLRPVPIRTAAGVIRSKEFATGGQYVQYPVDSRPGFRTPTTIQLADHFILAIEVDGRSDALRYAVNTTAASAFHVGQRVNIEYQTRGLAPFWTRVYVLDAQPAN